MSSVQKATFASGCFWCTEAVFKRLKGVLSVTSGYAGGEKENPSYEEVSSGVTGYAECIQVEFDEAVIPYTVLVDIFFATHDPTTLNRQQYDVGTQYRSVIFYHTEEQKKTAEKAVAMLTKSGKYKDPIVTKIEPLQRFYKAEDYHQDFYDKNRNYSYCTVIIDPKIQKLLKEFKKEVKEAYLHE